MRLYNLKSPALLVAALLLMLSPLSHADTSFNLGFGYGNARVKVDKDNFNDGSLGNTLSTDPYSNTWNIYGEVSFNRFIRMEFGLIDSGFASMSAFSNGSGTYWWYGPVSADYGLGAIKVGVLGVLPLGSNDRFKLLGKIGLVNWFSMVTLKNSFYEDTDLDIGISPYYGVGAEVDLTDLMTLRLQHEAFSASASSDYLANGYDLNYSSTTLGLSFRF